MYTRVRDQDPLWKSSGKGQDLLPHRQPGQPGDTAGEATAGSLVGKSLCPCRPETPLPHQEIGWVGTNGKRDPATLRVCPRRTFCPLGRGGDSHHLEAPGSPALGDSYLLLKHWKGPVGAPVTPDEPSRQNGTLKALKIKLSKRKRT